MTDWLTLPELAEHSRLSLSTLKRAITQKQNPLPSYLVKGRRLVRQAEYDLWATGKLSPCKRLKLWGKKRQQTTPDEPLDKDFQWRTGSQGDEPAGSS